MTARRLLKSLRDLVAPGVRRVNFVVLAIDVPDGVSPEDGFSVRDVLNSINPDGWWFTNPGTFMVYFQSDRHGVERAEHCRTVVESLRAHRGSLREMRFGAAEGPMITEIDRRGRPTSTPMGGAANEAFQRARA